MIETQHMTQDELVDWMKQRDPDATLASLHEKSKTAQRILERIVADADIMTRVAELPVRQHTAKTVLDVLKNQQILEIDESEFYERYHDWVQKNGADINALEPGMPRVQALQELGVLKKGVDADVIALTAGRLMRKHTPKSIHETLTNQRLLREGISESQFYALYHDWVKENDADINALEPGMPRVRALQEMGVLKEHISTQTDEHRAFKNNMKLFRTTTKEYSDALKLFKEELENNLKLLELEGPEFGGSDTVSPDYEQVEALDDDDIMAQMAGFSNRSVLSEEMLRDVIDELGRYIRQIGKYRNGVAPAPALNIKQNVWEDLLAAGMPVHPLKAILDAKEPENIWQGTQKERLRYHAFPEMPRDRRTMRRDEDGKPIPDSITLITSDRKSMDSVQVKYKNKAEKEHALDKLGQDEVLNPHVITDWARVIYLHDGNPASVQDAKLNIQSKINEERLPDGVLRYHEKSTLRASLFLNHAIVAPVGGVISEVRFMERGQHRAYIEGHKLYDIHDKEMKFDFKQVTEHDMLFQTRVDELFGKGAYAEKMASVEGASELEKEETVRTLATRVNEAYVQERAETSKRIKEVVRGFQRNHKAASYLINELYKDAYPKGALNQMDFSIDTEEQYDNVKKFLKEMEQALYVSFALSDKMLKKVYGADLANAVRRSEELGQDQLPIYRASKEWRLSLVGKAIDMNEEARKTQYSSGKPLTNVVPVQFLKAMLSKEERKELSEPHQERITFYSKEAKNAKQGKPTVDPERFRSDNRDHGEERKR